MCSHEALVNGKTAGMVITIQTTAGTESISFQSLNYQMNLIAGYLVEFSKLFPINQEKVVKVRMACSTRWI